MMIMAGTANITLYMRGHYVDLFFLSFFNFDIRNAVYLSSLTNFVSDFLIFALSGDIRSFAMSPVTGESGSVVSFSLPARHRGFIKTNP